MLPAQKVSSPSGSRRSASASGRSLYSTSAVRPPTWATTPMRSAGPTLRTTTLDISAPASAWYPSSAGRATRTSGLSTWKV